MIRHALYFVVTILTLASWAQAQNDRTGQNSPFATRGGTGVTARPPAPDPKETLEATEQTFRAIDEAALKQPPKREYKVEVGPPAPTKLFRADPKLLANKYVVTFALAVPTVESGSRLQQYERDLPPDMQHLAEIDSGAATGQGRGASIIDFKFLANHCPPEQRPGALVEYLTSADSERDIQRYVTRAGFGDRGFSSSGGGSSSPGKPFSGFQYSVFAPTGEEAEARAAAIIRLHDCGFSRPLQQYYYAEAQKELEAARTSYADYTKQTEAIRAEEEKIAKPSEISSDILSQLKAQKVMVAIELAGLNARVKACDAMLNEPKKLEVSTLQSISDMKVKAEIDRIGIKEKLDQINTFIGEGDRREATQALIKTLTAKRLRVERDVSNSLRQASAAAARLEFYAPRELQDNKITISPVEWTN